MLAALNSEIYIFPSATYSLKIKIFKMYDLRFHIGGCEEFSLVGCNAI
jgi:hypothetical protein